MQQFQDGQLIATLTQVGYEIRVEVRASGFIADRDFVAGWIFGTEQFKLARRLQDCILAGKAFSGYEIKTDVNGKTYISPTTTQFFHKRHMNSSLAACGF